MKLFRNRGFTLIEIIISMMFLSFGIMGVIALFFVGVNNGNVSMKHQKATIIAQEVRETLINALKFPKLEVNPANPLLTRTLYRFEMPSVIEDSAPANWNVDTVTKLNGFYFEINDDQPSLKNSEQVLFNFTNTARSMDERVLDLPFEAMDKSGASIKAETWTYRSYAHLNLDSDFDEDDTHFYSFRIVLRRSISVPSSGTLTPGDRLVATVYIFRQYNPALTVVEDYEPDFGYPKFEDSAGKIVSECLPILKYEFYIPAQ